MFTVRRFFPTLAIVIVGGSLLTFYSRGETTLQPYYAHTDGERATARPQRTDERIFRQDALQPELTIGEGDAPLLYGPLHLKLAPNGNLLVADHGDLTIKELAPDGRLLQTYGQGKGQGPGEFETITDFVKTPRGELWVADPSNGRLAVFDERGYLLRTVKSELLPYRFIPDDAGMMVMMPAGSPHLFHQLGPAGEPLGSFGSLLENQLRDGLVLDGWVAGMPDQTFVYAGRYAGLLASYSWTGEPHFLVEMIDPPSLPKLIENREGVKWVDREALSSALSVSVSGQEIHVLSPIETAAFKQKGAIDTYDRNDGTYLYSRHVPAPCGQVVVDGSALYTVVDATITRWRIAA